MSITGLDVFDKTVQTTNIWLNEIMAELGPDKQVAWKVLSTVLHKLRDQLPVDLAAHLGAELPLLVRGVYYDQYEPAKQPVQHTGYEGLRADVERWLSDIRPVNPDDAIRTVFGVLSRHISGGQVGKIQSALPKDVRQFWLSAAAPQTADAVS